MKKFSLILVLMASPAWADILTVPGVVVSITDQSAAVAREKAIAKGHRLAFQKALHLLGDATEGRELPSDEAIMALAKGFSVDREKNTNTSYAASMTFRFDEDALRNWAEGDSSFVQPHFSQSEMVAQPSVSQSFPTNQFVNAPERYVSVSVPLSSLPDLVAVEKMLEGTPVVRGVSLKSLTRNKADFELRVAGGPAQLNSALSQQGYALEEDGGRFTLLPRSQTSSLGWF